MNKHMFFLEDILEWLVGDRRQLFLLIFMAQEQNRIKIQAINLLYWDSVVTEA